MTHLFVGLGQKHVDNFEVLISNKTLGEGTFVLIAAKGLIINEMCWDKTIIASQSFDNTAASKLQQLKAISVKAKEYSRIVKQLKHFKKIPLTIYVAYIEDILSNYLFFNFNKEAKVIVIEDGTLNYYKHTIENIDPLKFKLKQLVARRHGLSFKKYKGHSSGASYDKVIAQYLSLPKEAYLSKKAKQLPLFEQPLDKVKNNLYIIGQEAFGAIIGQQRFMEALDSYFKALTEQPFYQDVSIIYYKPHRNGVRITQEFIASFFPDKEIQIIKTKKTAESFYFDEVQCTHISSFNSSTLLNIYAALQQEDKEKIGFYTYPLVSDELVPLFKKLNFKFLKSNTTA